MGNIRLLNDGEYCPNEVVLKVEKDKIEEVSKILQNANLSSLANGITTPNLPAWRLKKYIYENIVP